MAKDPAINWYFDNWNGGTFGMSRFHKGCYMDLLTAQYHIGHLSLEQIKNILGNDFSAWQTLKTKFVQDENKNFFNERLAAEVRKRLEYSKKQSERVKKRWDNKDNGIYHGINNGNTTVLPVNEIGTETVSFERCGKLFFDLTDLEISGAVEYMHRVKQKTLTGQEIKSLFEAFKIQYQSQFYHHRGKVINHFNDWLKKQDLKPVNGREKPEPYKRFKF